MSLDIQRFFKRKPVDPTKNLTIRQVLSVTKPRSFPTWAQWLQLPTVLNKTEKRYLISALAVFFLASGSLLTTYVIAHRVDVPAVGGEYTEAVIGDPRLINPLYTPTNDVDADLSALVYSGLLKWDGSKLVPDLAESMEVNDAQTRFTFHLKKNAKFSNGDDLTVKDVVFTVSAIKNPAYRSPLLNAFRSVAIEQVDDTTLAFVLDKPDASFLQQLTVGILPESLWSDILPNNMPLAALNLQPIGSGPYAFSSFAKDKKGSVRSFTFKRNTHYYGEEPKIDQITFKFYPDANTAAQALMNKNTEGLGFVSFENLAPVENNRSVRLNDVFLPRSTALYFNTSNSVLKNIAVRNAIASAIDKQALVQIVLHNHGRVITSPILENAVGYNPTLSMPAFDLANAQAQLDTAGFVKKDGAQLRLIPTSKPAPIVIKNKKGKVISTTQAPVDAPKTLTLNLTVIDSPELTAIANAIKSQLNSVGIGIDIQPIPATQFMSSVVDSQNYDLLLAPSVGSANSDPYLFWHSSQIGKGGLNISHYQNKTVDSLLEKGRNAVKSTDREAAYRQFQEILVKDMPAVFLYQSSFPFAVAKKIQMKPLETIRVPSDRFSNITSWFIKTKKTLR